MPRKIVRALSRFTKAEIDFAFSKARRLLRHTGFDILAAPAQKEIGRILVIASRKVGNAPIRNKIRRRLKAIYFTHKLYEKGFDIIVLVKKAHQELSFSNIEHALVTTLSSAHTSS
jgi:ribonuclease P protein component